MTNTHINPTSNQCARHITALSSAVLGVGVLLGAFGAHDLKNIASAQALDWWQTATLYLFVHGLAMLVLSVLVQLKWCRAWLAYVFLAGIVLFSGSLYAMALGLPRWLGAITPLGGLCFVAAWSVLVWQLLSNK